MASVREEKISTELKRELSVLLRDIKDPRIPLMTSVMKTEVTKDLKFAKIYVSVMGNEDEKASSLEALKNATGFIKREIGQRLNLRGVPHPSFVLDRSIDYGAHINSIISKINKE